MTEVEIESSGSQWYRFVAKEGTVPYGEADETISSFVGYERRGHISR